MNNIVTYPGFNVIKPGLGHLSNVFNASLIFIFFFVIYSTINLGIICSKVVPLRTIKSSNLITVYPQT